MYGISPCRSYEPADSWSRAAVYICLHTAHEIRKRDPYYEKSYLVKGWKWGGDGEPLIPLLFLLVKSKG